MNPLKYSSLLLLALFFAASSCKKKVDEPKDPNEEELITTLKLTFLDSTGAQAEEAIFRDSDGIGGNAPTREDTIRISANSTYTVNVTLLDESGSTAEDITTEVREEATAHQLFYNIASAPLAIEYLDKDSNGLPIGLQTEWKTQNSGNGNVQVILKHQPDLKSGEQAPGETDIDVTFRVEVQ